MTRLARPRGTGGPDPLWRGPAGPRLGKASLWQPGRLKKVQGIGWYLDEKNLAQVSTNLLDFDVTGLHTVYEETCREAKVSRTASPTLWGALPPSPGADRTRVCRS